MSGTPRPDLVAMPARSILVTGAAGSGTTTLAASMAQVLGFGHVDADDCYWLPSEPPYREKRSPGPRAAALRRSMDEAMRTAPGVVVSGSVMGWGDDIELGFDRIVFLLVDTATRLQRLVQRERARFGRVDPAFLRWAAAYDAGTEAGRSLSRHRAWLASRRCPVQVLDGHDSVPQRLTQVLRALEQSPLP